MYVLDSSVFIAVIKSEPGSDKLLAFIEGSAMCAINESEVLQKAAEFGGSVEAASEMLADFDYRTIPFDDQRAAETAALWPLTRHLGLSLADRSCLALARAMNGIAVTADRAWGKLEVPGLDVHVIARV